MRPNPLYALATSRKAIVTAISAIASVLLTVLWKSGSAADKATIVASITTLASVLALGIAHEDASATTAAASTAVATTTAMATTAAAQIASIRPPPAGEGGGS